MYTKEQLKEYIRSMERPFYTLAEPDEDHIRFMTGYACGEVIFHPKDIVELQITDNATSENRFYLHFQLRDEQHAKRLIREMTATLRELKQKQVIRVLLTCTSALTTSYFAAELNKAAETLKLNYEFAAVSVHLIYNKGFDSDVILVAPQAAFEYEKIRQIFSGKIVLTIPASVFGQYSTGGVLELLMDALQHRRSSAAEDTPPALRTVFDNPYRILSICLINHRDEYRIGYRIYDNGRKTLDKEVIKPTYTLRDIIDLIEYVLVRHKYIHAIGLALPGIANHGILYHKDSPVEDTGDIGLRLSRKYNKPVILINDVNAVALGYLALNEHSENMVFHFQPRGIHVPGAGILIDGHLHRGWKSAAGEMGGLIEATVSDPGERILTPDGALEIVGKALVGYVSILAPAKIVIYSELTPDMELLRNYLKQYVAEQYIPELVHVKHLKEFMIPGAMIHALEVLQNDPEIYGSPDFVRILKNAQKGGKFKK